MGKFLCIPTRPQVGLMQRIMCFSYPLKLTLVFRESLGTSSWSIVKNISTPHYPSSSLKFYLSSKIQNLPCGLFFIIITFLFHFSYFFLFLYLFFFDRRTRKTYNYLSYGREVAKSTTCKTL